MKIDTDPIQFEFIQVVYGTKNTLIARHSGLLSLLEENVTFARKTISGGIGSNECLDVTKLTSVLKLGTWNDEHIHNFGRMKYYKSQIRLEVYAEGNQFF